MPVVLLIMSPGWAVSENAMLEVEDAVFESDEVGLCVECADKFTGMLEKKGEDCIRNQRRKSGVLQTQNDIPKYFAWAVLDGFIVLDFIFGVRIFRTVLLQDLRDLTTQIPDDQCSLFMDMPAMSRENIKCWGRLSSVGNDQQFLHHDFDQPGYG